MRTCKWTKNTYTYIFKTSCNHSLAYHAFSVEDRFSFCPFCGSPIERDDGSRNASAVIVQSWRFADGTINAMEGEKEYIAGYPQTETAILIVTPGGFDDKGAKALKKKIEDFLKED